jgi:hypothetical protein
LASSLVVRALFLLRAAAVRLCVFLALRLLPFRVWRPLLLAAIAAPRPAPGSDRASLDWRLAALNRTARFLPLGRCLEHALTAWLLLRRRYPAAVRLGVARKPGRDLFAHACLEVNGAVVLGQSQDSLHMLNQPYTQPLLTRHEPLVALTGKTAEKDPLADKDPNEKDPTADKASEGPA